MYNLLNQIVDIFDTIYLILNIFLGVVVAIALALPYIFRKQIKKVFKENWYAFLAYAVSFAVVLTVFAEYFVQLFRSLTVVGEFVVLCVFSRREFLNCLVGGCSWLTLYARCKLRFRANEAPLVEKVRAGYFRLSEKLNQNVRAARPCYNMLS